MIRRMQLLNYRCLRYVDVALERFHVLAGATGTGKSAFLDAIGFLSDLIRDGPDAAVGRRTDSFRNLVWGRPEDDPRFELAAEFEIAGALRQKLSGGSDFQRFRYEVVVSDRGAGVGIESERGILIPGASVRVSRQQPLFTDPPPLPESIPSESGRRGSMTVFSKSTTGNDSFNVETAGTERRGWAVRIALGPRRSTLANLPDTPALFPIATRIRDLLARRVLSIGFDAARMRSSRSPARRTETPAPDGWNLAWEVGRFLETDPAGFREWSAQLRKALPELEDVVVAEPQGDPGICLKIRETSGMELPLEALSDGALMLFALTLLPRLPTYRGIWLMRTGIDGLDDASLPVACESLSTAPDSQALVEVHQGVSRLVQTARPDASLHFERNAEGAASIVPGNALGDFETAGGTFPANLQ